MRYCTGSRPTGMPAQPGRPPRAAPANSVRFAAVLEDVNVRLPGRRVEFADGATHTIRLPRFPRLSDNGSSYIAGDLADWLEEQGMDHVRGAPNHPQTQGKIERWHQTLKNRILL